MSTKIKLIITLSFISLLIGYVYYSQNKISSQGKEIAKLEESVRESTSSLNTLHSLLQSYEDALEQKEQVLNEVQIKIQEFKSKLKGLDDEDSKRFLTITTPDNVRSMLESTDYYKRTSSSISSSKLPDTK